MIFYFSGTGNSQLIAERIAKETKDTLGMISSCTPEIPENDSTLGLVFPIHAWGIPHIMKEFVQQLVWNITPSYIYMVCTCGDDIGYTHLEMERLLKHRGLHLDAAWSLIMPNTYVTLPGFDIDPPVIAQKKMETALESVPSICSRIINKEKGICEVNPGSFAWLKSYLLRPLFLYFLTGDRQFKSDERCKHCGICAKSCPTQNISYDAEGRPVWHGHCTNCLNCYHHCPYHAILFGKFTKGKGQYQIQDLIDEVLHR